MNRTQTLGRRIRWLTWFFIVGLVESGVTAIPLNLEVDRLINFLGIEEWGSQPIDNYSLETWLFRVRDGLDETQSQHPFLFYGTDWLAFGHFVIAVAFIGALRDPVRNRWLFDFGLIACAQVVPYAIIFGGMRGIPVWWRLIDCSFGVFGAVPLWFCRKWTNELERR